MPVIVIVDKVDNPTIVIGDGPVERVISGTGLDTAGLRAVVPKLDPNDPHEPAVSVTQPLPEDVAPDSFRVTISVPARSKVGPRAVEMQINGVAVFRKDGAITLVT
jgi:hypothetical protein